MLLLLTVLALQQQPNSAPQLVVTPASPTVAARDSLRLRARLVDAQGQPVPNVRYSFVASGYSFEASVDTAGLVHAGAVGVFPVTAVALLPNHRMVTKRVEVRIVPGPPARIVAQPAAVKLLAGQRVAARADVFSAANDRRDDRVTWISSAPAVVEVSPAGVITAVAPGRARVTARVGDVTQDIPVEVVSADVASVQVLPQTRTARTGDVIRFRAAVRDRQGREIEGLTPTWLLSPGAGMIGEDGAFVAYRPGAYQVTASFGSRSADANVTVEARDVGRSTRLVGKVLRTQFPTSEVWIHPNGRVAYLGSTLGGDRLWAIDVSSPANPVIVDSLVVNARSINDLMTTPDGNYLVITREGAADRKNGILIADTRDPLHPKPLTEFTEDVTSGVHSAFVHRQEKFGTHVYLTNDGTGALHIVDITDPAKPKETARWRPKQTKAGVMLHDVDVQDGLVYASWWNDGLV
ncbi:MAG: Ig-like domain-containing protein, partial [Gemmatimonadaceae bacterium]